MYTCKTKMRCVIHLSRLSGKTSEHSWVHFIDKPRPCLNYYLFLHLNISRRETPFVFNLWKHFFVVYIFTHRSGSGPPHQYLQNKNHEKQYLTVWYRVATLNTSHAQNVILRICFFKVVTLRYNPCTMYISSLFGSSHGGSCRKLLSTPHAQNLYSHYPFTNFC